VNPITSEQAGTIASQTASPSVKSLPVHQRPAGGGGGSSLAEQATNPVSNLLQIQIQNSYSWDNYNSSGDGNTFVFQPVIPISLPFKAVPLWVSRTTLPYVRTPGIRGVGHKHGFGDITMNNFWG
jgi:hypothetical protein